MSKTRLEKIDGIKEEIEQLRIRQKLLLQQHNAQERKARNHRLCRRGGIVEKLLPDLIALTDEQFDTFVEKALLTGYAEKIIKGLTVQNGTSASKAQSGSTDQEKDHSAAKTTAAETSHVPAGMAEPPEREQRAG